ncbi:hypothetical protein ACK6T9_15855, partial [Proteus vulgaris]|uniref:hypothetical protein n=1 Tax=Proteus vulgaris TaxID=585 RepID=UPI0039B52C4E
DYHQTNQKTNTGKTLKPWPILVDHYTASIQREQQRNFELKNESVPLSLFLSKPAITQAELNTTTTILNG